MSASTALAAPPAAPAGRRPRVVLWLAVAAGVVVAVMVTIFALVGSPADTTPLLGRPAPAIDGAAVFGGRHVSLAQYAGKWVLVDFGASWCVDCREELPQLQRFAATAARYDAVLLTIDEQPSDAASLSGYMRANHADWPVVEDQAATLTYGVRTIPAIYLVDPVGYVYAFYPAGIQPASLDATLTAAIRDEGSS